MRCARAPFDSTGAGAEFDHADEDDDDLAAFEADVVTPPGPTERIAALLVELGVIAEADLELAELFSIERVVLGDGPDAFES